MSGSQQIEFGILPPTTPNCLSWSEDGDLAIAANDEVYVLLVNQKYRSQDATVRKGDPWHRVRLTVDSFTEAEWPSTAMQSMSSFSIGEEQGAVRVIALAWSPSGLAARHRCVLAVLTSNYLLSIWGPGSDPTRAKEWQRLQVINRHSASGWISVMAMSWLPVIDTRDIKADPFISHLAAGPNYWIHCLTVLSRKRRIHLFKITKTANGSLQTQEVQSTPLGEPIALQGDSQVTNSLREEIQASLYIDSMVRSSHGSSWTKAQPTSDESISFQNIALGITVIYSYHTGFVLFQSSATAATFAKALVSVEPSVWKGALNIHHMAADNDRSGERCLLISGVHLSLRSARLLSSGQLRDSHFAFRLKSGESRLDQRIKVLMASYSKELNLGGRVETQVWGLASWCGYIAICVSLHPTHALQYMMQSNSKLYILFSHKSLETTKSGAANPMDPMQAFPLGPEVTPKDDFLAHYKDEYMAHGGGIIWPGVFALEPFASPRLDLYHNARLIFANVIALYFHTAPGSGSRIDLHNITLQLADLAAIHPVLAELVTIIQSTSLPDPSALETSLKDFITQRHALEQRDPSGLLFIERCTIPTCHGPILWRADWHTAKCANGHHHVRCVLTSLALMNPFVVKRCEACRRVYLDEEALDVYYEDGGSTEHSAGTRDEKGMERQRGEEGRTSGLDIGGTQNEGLGANGGKEEDGLRWMLNNAVVCIYCGGKFVRELPLPKSDPGLTGG